MSEGSDPLSRAVEALRTRGHYIEPAAGDHMLWLVDGEPMTESELVALAIRLGLIGSLSTRP